MNVKNHHHFFSIFETLVFALTFTSSIYCEWSIKQKTYISLTCMEVRHSLTTKLDAPKINLLILDLGSTTIVGAYLRQLCEFPSILSNTHISFAKVNELKYIYSSHLKGKKPIKKSNFRFLLIKRTLIHRLFFFPLVEPNLSNTLKLTNTCRHLQRGLRLTS